MKKAFWAVSAIFAVFLTALADDNSARAEFAQGLDEEKSGDFYDAAKKYMAAELLADDSVLKMNALKKASDAYSKAGFRYKQFQCLQKLVVCYPAMVDFKGIILKEYEIGTQFYKGKRDPAFYWMPWLEDDDRTVEIYEAVLKNAAFTDFSPELRLRLAKIYIEENKIDEAIKIFKEIAEYHPGTKQARFAEFELANIYLQKARRGDGDAHYCNLALELIKELIKKYPDDPEMDWLKSSLSESETLASERIYGMAKFYDRRENTAAAARYCTTILRDFPESAAAVRAERMIASRNLEYVPSITEYKPRPGPKYKIQEMPDVKDNILVVPENSNGKWLLPVEDLGIKPKDN